MADRSMWDRMKGAAMLDIPTYEEVEHDESLTVQAAMVVIIVAIARGLGGRTAERSGSSAECSGPCSAGFCGRASPT